MKDGWLVPPKSWDPKSSKSSSEALFEIFFFYKGKPKVNKGYSRSILKASMIKHEIPWCFSNVFVIKKPMMFPWFSHDFHDFCRCSSSIRSVPCCEGDETAAPCRSLSAESWYLMICFFFRYVFIFYDMLNWIEQTSEKYRKRGHCKAWGVLIHLTCWDWGLWCVTVFMRARWDQEFAVLVYWSVFCLRVKS
jgi:hypothetical protein